MTMTALEDWTYDGYGDDEVEILSEPLAYDEDGYPTLTKLVFTDLTGKIPCQDLEDFAHRDAAVEFTIRSSGWTEDGRSFVVEVQSVTEDRAH